MGAWWTYCWQSDANKTKVAGALLTGFETVVSLHALHGHFYWDRDHEGHDGDGSRSAETEDAFAPSGHMGEEGHMSP